MRKLCIEQDLQMYRGSAFVGHCATKMKSVAVVIINKQRSKAQLSTGEHPGNALVRGQGSRRHVFGDTGNNQL